MTGRERAVIFSRLRILITNNRLNTRGGAESFVRDLARGLQEIGHSVMAYSSDLGQRERLLENDVIPVATDLDLLPFLPDIIHAQHHLDAMTAITALPEVPALFHCHGAVWQECAPKHPRIYHYLAMSKTLAERMAVESNIPISDISVHLNVVDLARFNKVRQPPSQPTRALFFNKHHRQDSPTVAAIREAASRCGISLDFVGRHFGRLIDQPENFLPDYDIVFASGVSAIEALACGCAVVVLGRTSCGGLVLPDNLESYRQANFSIAVNSAPPSSEKIEAELRCYSSEACEMVAKRLRQMADSRLQIGKLAEIYQQIIERHQRSEHDSRAESVAVSKYLRRIVPLVKMADQVQRQEGLHSRKANALNELREHLSLVERELSDAQ